MSLWDAKRYIRQGQYFIKLHLLLVYSGTGLTLGQQSWQIFCLQQTNRINSQWFCTRAYINHFLLIYSKTSFFGKMQQSRSYTNRWGSQGGRGIGTKDPLNFANFGKKMRNFSKNMKQFFWRRGHRLRTPILSSKLYLNHSLCITFACSQVLSAEQWQ